MKASVLWVGVLLCVGVQSALAEPKSRRNLNFDEPAAWQEVEQPLPPYPSKPDWVSVTTDNLQTNQYFVDAGSVSVGEDKVVRLVVRIVSPKGVENLSFEGIQCEEATYRAYAFGNSVDHTWIASTRVVWREINSDDKLRRQLRTLLCPGKRAPASVDEAVLSLRKG
ncbi:CNP1-like family protein [Neisseriaceae bacterium TC5R-5]|nr:CNP1-like family protein [Neisseriaceae bacterium TC5R-5]